MGNALDFGDLIMIGEEMLMHVAVTNKRNDLVDGLLVPTPTPLNL